MRIATGLVVVILVVIPPLIASMVLAPPALGNPDVGAAATSGAALAAGSPTATGADSPLRLLASLEEAWLGPDAERLASLVDTTSVRIGLKPGVPPAAAVTRSAAAFLFQDQLRLVKTRDFRVVKLEVPKKGPARAVASWEGDWGGRQGMRTLEVKLTAVAVGGRWLFTEVRAED
jgi:hypothetical protein